MTLKMTPQLKIHVNGNASVSRTAERGVLHIKVWHTAPSQADVSSAVATKSETLTNLFRQHALKTDGNQAHPDAPITTFTFSAPSTSSRPPSPLETLRISPSPDRMYTAETTAVVVFRDLALLAQLAVELSAMENVSIQQTEWHLTDFTQDQITREARINAMRNAVEKANDYAAVVGREVVPFRINDGNVNTTGMHLRQSHRLFGQATDSVRPSLFGGLANDDAPSAEGTVAAGPSLEPATLSVSANVSVDFVSMDGDVMPNATTSQPFGTG